MTLYSTVQRVAPRLLDTQRTTLHRLRLPTVRTFASAQTPTDDLTHADSDAHPETQNILKKHERYFLGTYARIPLIFTHGRGCNLYDLGGRKYLDFTAGIAVNALGHADAGVAEALADQAGRLVHTSNLFHHKPAGDLAQRLVDSTGSQDGKGKTLFKADKVFFTNSGTEANEGALKFARKAGKLLSEDWFKGNPKHGIVSFTNGFHGRSMGALSATPNKKYQAPFLPLVPGFMSAPFNNVEAAVDAISETTCAVIMEPIQGEGGVFEATTEFVTAVRQKCDQVGALLIFDEIQCGLGRTGKLWAFENLPETCQPDMVTIAKPLANGVPIGAVLLNEKVAKTVAVGDHGTTFGGNPLACRVADHVVRRISEPTFLTRVERIGNHLRTHLTNELSSSPLVTEIRGRGMMLAVQFTVDPSPLVKMARERGLLVITAGNNTIRIVPPLILGSQEAEDGAKILGRAVRALEASLNAKIE